MTALALPGAGRELPGRGRRPLARHGAEAPAEDPELLLARRRQARDRARRGGAATPGGSPRSAPLACSPPASCCSGLAGVAGADAPARAAPGGARDRAARAARPSRRRRSPAPWSSRRSTRQPRRRRRGHDLECLPRPTCGCGRWRSAAVGRDRGRGDRARRAAAPGGGSDGARCRLPGSVLRLARAGGLIAPGGAAAVDARGAARPRPGARRRPAGLQRRGRGRPHRPKGH